MDKSHLCTACRRVMCRECKAIADEYIAMLATAQARTRELEQELNATRAELTRERQRTAERQEIMDL